MTNDTDKIINELIPAMYEHERHNRKPFMTGGFIQNRLDDIPDGSFVPTIERVLEIMEEHKLIEPANGWSIRMEISRLEFQRNRHLTRLAKTIHESGGWLKRLNEIESKEKAKEKLEQRKLVWPLRVSVIAVAVGVLGIGFQIYKTNVTEYKVKQLENHIIRLDSIINQKQ